MKTLLNSACFLIFSFVKALFITIFLVICCGQLLAQPYTEKERTRHRFAQLLLGIDYRFMPGHNTQSAYMNAENQMQALQLNNQNETRLLISGTHFWGHADFYVALPVISWGGGYFTSGIETGAKYYPWRIENNKIRPYMGIALSATGFKQNDGPTLTKPVFPLLAGLTFYKKKHLLELSLAYNYSNTSTYYISRDDYTSLKTYPLWITLGYKFMFEATLSEEKEWLNGSTRKRTDALATEGKLNSFSLAIGPSSTWFTHPSEYNNAQYPFLGNHKLSGGFFEFGAGYYHHRWDAHLNLAYRNIDSKIGAYGLEQKINRRALTLETYKFLFDYHGFVPFIGPALSQEWLSGEAYDNGMLIGQGEFSGIKPGITFGWDIRPNRIKAWVLRTNLRYFPNLYVKMPNGQKIAFDQIEFNFIQLVIYPQRFRIK